MLILFSVFFLCAAVLTLAFVPLCSAVAQKCGCVDKPKNEAHKTHEKSTPLLGGAAMFCGFACSVMIGAAAAFYFLSPDFSAGIKNVLPEILTLGVAVLAALVWGTWDDIRPMGALRKFCGQLVIALFVVFVGGLRISLFIPSGFLSGIITVLWLLLLFNAVNFFDNMDGLAAGMATIALLAFSIVSCVNGQYLVAGFCLCSAGAAAGFWLVNTHPAKMFMGDGGSHFLALVLGIASIKVAYYNPAMESTRFAVLIPLFILAVPLFDALAVIVIRLYQHRPVYKGDNYHISHRFLAFGFSRPRAVQLVHLLCLMMTLGALPILWGDVRTCIILLAQGAVFLSILSVIQYAVQTERSEFHGKKD